MSRIRISSHLIPHSHPISSHLIPGDPLPSSGQMGEAARARPDISLQPRDPACGPCRFVFKAGKPLRAPVEHEIALSRRRNGYAMASWPWGWSSCCRKFMATMNRDQEDKNHEENEGMARNKQLIWPTDVSSSCRNRGTGSTSSTSGWLLSRSASFAKERGRSVG